MLKASDLSHFKKDCSLKHYKWDTSVVLLFEDRCQYDNDDFKFNVNLIMLPHNFKL